MYSVLDVASYMSKLSNNKISKLKIQRVCYYIQREYINMYGEPLFNEDFEVWENGVVCKELLNHDIKKYKNNQIELDTAAKTIISDVYDRYKDYSDIDLIILGEEDKLWRYVRDTMGKGSIIAKEMMKERKK